MIAPLSAFREGGARTMTQTLGEPPPSPVKPVLAGQDQHGEHHGLGVSHIDFKVSGQGRDGLFVLENIFHQQGGPARHLHVEQDEWFYIVEGQFRIEIGDETFLLTQGDSVFAPRQVPHVWAHTGNAQGRILITFRPAGDMEAFFREVTKANMMPLQDPKLWQAHGMRLLGPPLPVS